SSSKERRLEYFRSGTNADCEVHAVSDGGAGSVCYKKFRCHRIFLATASEKLEKDIFQNKQWNGILLINGVSKESVEIFLEYIYTFEVSPRLVDLKIIGDIFVLACAYNMPELMSQFSEQMKSKDWPLDSIFPAFDLAFRHNIIDLEEACLKKILENAADLKSEATIMKLQIYAFNYVIQHWKSMEIMAQSEIIHLLQAYQKHNDIRFSKADVFPHFSKIINYFPSILLDADGFIHKY
ncbi:CG14262, partial [Drosophila busckii]